jgi:hypothetical protein
VRTKIEFKDGMISELKMELKRAESQLELPKGEALAYLGKNRRLHSGILKCCGQIHELHKVTFGFKCNLYKHDHEISWFLRNQLPQATAVGDWKIS